MYFSRQSYAFILNNVQSVKQYYELTIYFIIEKVWVSIDSIIEKVCIYII